MIRFGFSAYLKIICLNEGRQRTEIRHRLNPNGSAYDYHRSLRLLARSLLAGEALEVVLASTSSIRKDAERNSARSGLEQLHRWRTEMGGAAFGSGPSATYTSPNDLFCVNYTPDFCMDFDGRSTGIHLWNTQSPPLQDHFVQATLALFRDLQGDEVEDLAVLSLRDLTLYRLSDVPAEQYFNLGVQIASNLEGRIAQISTEEIAPSAVRRRSAPPPAAA